MFTTLEVYIYDNGVVNMYFARKLFLDGFSHARYDDFDYETQRVSKLCKKNFICDLIQFMKI